MRVHYEPGPTPADVRARWFGWGVDAFWKLCVLIAPLALTGLAIATVAHAVSTGAPLLDSPAVRDLSLPGAVTALVIGIYGTAAVALNWRNVAWTEGETLHVRRGVLPWVGYQRRVFARGDIKRISAPLEYDMIHDSEGTDDYVWAVRVETRGGRGCDITPRDRRELAPRALAEKLEAWRLGDRPPSVARTN